MPTTIRITTTLPATPEAVWRRLSQVDTLRYIARPYAYFTPLEPMTQWAQGAAYVLSLRVFGLLPLGRHHIRVVRWDQDALEILTHEHNRFVKTWNHAITLEALPDGRTRFTDAVTLDAGAFTGLARLWSIAFYRHRQRKWRKLLCKTQS